MTMMMISKKTCLNSQFLAEEIVLEIITKLHIKKVFQLTCVSKLWRSLILHPDFLQIYRSRNPNPTVLVITVFKEYDSREFISVYHSILKPHEEEYVDDDHTPEKFVNSLNMSDAVRITQTVNGLVCVCYNDSMKRRCLALMRVRTGEIVMKLPYTGNHRLARYCLGFEPVNKVYKLLKIGKPARFFLPDMIDSNCYDFGTLTLSRRSSDMCWNTLPATSSSDPAVFGTKLCEKCFETQSFSVNGFLFWMYKNYSTQLLISFDLKENKFRAINLPRSFAQMSRFTQFRGRLGLYNGEEEEGGLYPVIYTLDDKEGVNWTRHVITLPCEVVTKIQSSPVGKRCRAIPVGNLPRGELLLALVGTDDPATPIYSYDYTNEGGSFKKFVVGKFPEECADRRDDESKWYNNAYHIPNIHFSVDDGIALLHLNDKPL